MIQSEHAFDALQRLIEEGTIEPDSMVSERYLMELTGLGRTPIREAVQRLERNHMVRVHPSKGIKIPANSVEDQLYRLEVRRSMEVFAVKMACDRATSRDIELIGELAERLKGEFSFAHYGETVRETHTLITNAAHNPYLEALMSPLQALSRRFWITYTSDERAEVLSGKILHRNILVAIVQRDGSRAEAASLALNDYLVEFAMRTIIRKAPMTRPFELS